MLRIIGPVVYGETVRRAPAPCAGDEALRQYWSTVRLKDLAKIIGRGEDYVRARAALLGLPPRVAGRPKGFSPKR